MEAESHIITAQIDWQGITLSVTYDPASFGTGAHAVAHLELRSISPAGAALPVTETGYRSHFLSPVYVEQAGGPVAYAIAWLNRAAAAPEWQRHVAATQQLSLF